MFGKTTGAPQRPPAGLSPGTEALVRAIRERSAQDPLIGAKIGGKEVFSRLVDGLKNERGVHVESLLCALGALAGYACQAALRAQAMRKGVKETAPFHVVTTSDGRDYFYGDPLNNVLAGQGPSVWGLVAGAAEHHGIALPDLDEIFKHTTDVLGTPQFGIPRMPENHGLGDTPLNYLKALWPALLPTVKLLCPDPAHWPALYGMAAQQGIDVVQEAARGGKPVMDPALAVRIVMESAVAMSKVDLARS